VFEIGARAALKGVPVATAISAICVDCNDVDLDGKEELGVGESAFVWSEPSDVVVTLGADALLQQLLRSFGARQQ
jgi:hypothetical protein